MLARGLREKLLTCKGTPTYIFLMSLWSNCLFITFLLLPIALDLHLAMLFQLKSEGSKVNLDKIYVTSFMNDP